MSKETILKEFEQEYWGKFGSTKTINDIKQFISDLRKQDEEELIKRLDYLDNNREEHQIIGEFKQLIKDYYEK